jgi:hypothetical protein
MTALATAAHGSRQWLSTALLVLLADNTNQMDLNGQ